MKSSDSEPEKIKHKREYNLKLTFLVTVNLIQIPILMY